MIRVVFTILALAQILLGMSPEEALTGLIPLDNFRYETFLAAMDLFTTRNLSFVLETGTARFGDQECLSDGCSTVLFSKWLNSNPGKTLISVDINQDNIDIAQAAIQGFSNSTTFALSDGAEYLKAFNGSIDFLYIDSLDFNPLDYYPADLDYFIWDDFDEYKAQHYLLAEIHAAYSRLHADSIVMLDDCQVPFSAKCRLVAGYLGKRGWKVLLHEYQTIFVWQ